MPENQPAVDVESLLTHLGDRGLGDIPPGPNAREMADSEAQLEGAVNLLDKALTSIDRGDDERARRLVDRAAALPYDEFEGTHPAAWQAQGMLVMAMSDRAETGDGEDWLDAALEALESAPPHGRCTLRDCLEEMVAEWELPADQLRRIRAAVADVPARPELRDLEVERAELADAVLGTLEALIAFEDALPPGMSS